jgi:hypothetical protein
MLWPDECVLFFQPVTAVATIVIKYATTGKTLLYKAALS